MLGTCEALWMAGVDLDTCRDPQTGTIDPWALKVQAGFNTYAEVSPSETGIKLFFLLCREDVERVRPLLSGQGKNSSQWRRRNGAAHPPAIELHIDRRYFAVTWEGLDDAPAELRTVPFEDLLWLIEKVGPAFTGKPNGSNGTRADTDASDDILARLNRAARNNRAIETALRNASTMRGGSRSEGAMGLGAALKRAGWSYTDIKGSLLACPASREWATEKLAEGECQFERIWEKAGTEQPKEQATSDDATTDTDRWGEPVDFLADAEITGAPELSADHIPSAIAPFVFDTAARMGVDPSAVALCALVACASVISDEWRIQPKVHDTTWTEQPRIWGAIVGDPSILKSPVIAACTKPIDRLESEARRRHEAEMQRYKAELAEWKKDKEDDEPRHPALDRYMVENLTVEALTEVLRDDPNATQRAPASKVLVRSDELAELLANMDRYNAGGRGAGDRGAYLRLFNGGRHTIDRVSRGHFACPNWSACILGGIQPGPIQRIARDAADDGMLQRFLYCVPTGQASGLDRAPNYDAIGQYEALFPALSTLLPGHAIGHDHPDVVRLHAHAHQHRKALDELVTALKEMPDTTARMKAGLGKFPGIYARLCLIFHLIECTIERVQGLIGRPLAIVTEATAKRAMLYLRDIVLPNLGRAEAVMYLTAQTGHARWIAGFILSRGLTRIARRDITRAYGYLRAPECATELTSVMEGLASMGWAREEKPDNPARAPAAWSVNPKVHTLFVTRAELERKRRREAQAATAEIIRRCRREG
jgi:hypothetical protein